MNKALNQDNERQAGKLVSRGQETLGQYTGPGYIEAMVRLAIGGGTVGFTRSGLLLE